MDIRFQLKTVGIGPYLFVLRNITHSFNPERCPWVQYLGKIYGLNTCYTELENCFEIFQGKANKKCHGRTFWALRTDKNVNQCYFLKISRKLKQKYINVLGSIFESKKSMAVFFSTVQFLTYDLLNFVKLA